MGLRMCNALIPSLCIHKSCADHGAPSQGPSHGSTFTECRRDLRFVPGMHCQRAMEFTMANSLPSKSAFTPGFKSITL
jgi:hypothetical protein